MSLNRTARRVGADRGDPQPASSAALADELARLDADCATATARLAELEASRNQVLLLDDDARAEAHDAEMARQRRAIERYDLKRPAAVEAVAAAKGREERERIADQQEKARAAVAAVLARLDAEYAEPARLIAAFLVDWRLAEALARDAGVDTPDRLSRYRPPGVSQPERRQTTKVYVDERGRDSTSPYPIGSYMIHPVTGEPYYELERKQDEPLAAYQARVFVPSRKVTRRRERTFVETVPAVMGDAVFLGGLADHVSLPPPRIDAETIWSASALTERREHSSRPIFG